MYEVAKKTDCVACGASPQKLSWPLVVAMNSDEVLHKTLLASAYQGIMRQQWRLLPVADSCTTIKRSALPRAQRALSEWRTYLYPSPIEKRPDRAAQRSEIPRPPAEDSRVLKIGILGATPETPNLGLSMLATGAVGCMLHAYPDAKLFFLDYAQERTRSVVTAGPLSVSVPLVNLCRSKKFWRQNHIIVLLLAALLLRLIPSASLRNWLTRHNAWLDEILSADLFGSIAGGDSFSDLYGWRHFLYVALPQILVLLLNKRLILLPQTYGPFRRRWTRRLAQMIVLHAEKAWCRDHESLTHLMKGIAPPADRRIKFCYDLGFALDSYPPPHIQVEGFEWARVEKANLIGLNISGPLFRNGYTGKSDFGIRTSYQELIHKVITFFLRQSQSRILLIPHVHGTDRGSDITACQQVFAEERDQYPKRIGILRGTYGPNGTGAVIGRCGFFVGSRMHACIAAASQCIPAVSLAYSDKFLGVMQTVGMAQLVVDIRILSADQILAILQYAYEHRDEIAGDLAREMPGIRSAVWNLLRTPPIAIPNSETSYASR